MENTITQSTIFNSSMHTTKTFHKQSQIAFEKKNINSENISIKNNIGDELIIPISVYKSFCMAALEAYCQFSKDFENENVDITVTTSCFTKK
jgi:hypothetical protein